MKESVEAQCPECNTGIADRIEKQISGDETRARLTCSNCGHEWTHRL